MPTNKTIAELCEKHWPEGCPHFASDGNIRVFCVDARTRVCIPLKVNKDWLIDELKAWSTIIAAVAAQHWRNAQRRTGLEINALDKNKHFGPFGISIHARKLVDKQALAGKAAESWETLANDL